MTGWWADLGIALALAAAFSAAGEILLGRSGSSVFDLNESFLAGLGVAAALLFPFSLLFGRFALPILLGLVLAALPAALLTRRFRPRGGISPPEGWWRPATPLFRVFAAAAAAAFAVFAVLNQYYSLGWDGFIIWASKAQILFHSGRIDRFWYPSFRTNFTRLPKYPPLVPLIEAFQQKLRGGFEFDSVKPLFLLFHASALLSIYRAGRRFAPPALAAAGAALVGWLPGFTATTNAGGYADMPLAAYVAAALAALLWASESSAASLRAAAVLCGSLCLVKKEGAILSGAFALAVGAEWLGAGTAVFREKLFRYRREITAAAAVIAARLAYLGWAGIGGRTYISAYEAEFFRAAGRIPLVAFTCLEIATGPSMWGVFWPAFALAAVALLRFGSRTERTLALATFATASAYAGIFLFLRIPDLVMLTHAAYDRLLEQIAPAAAVAMVAAASRFVISSPPRP